MQVSLQSKFYFGACVAINVYNAYANPLRWITAFALGVLGGSFSAKHIRYYVQNGYDFRNEYDQALKANLGENAANWMARSVPDIGITVIQLLASGLLSQKISLSSSWSPQIGKYFCDFAAFEFGDSIGVLYQLYILQKSSDPKIKALLDKTTI